LRRVVMVSNSDFWYDSRVQKEALALSRAGYRVTVFSLTMAGPREQDMGGIRLLNPTTTGLAWFPYKPSYLKAYWQVMHALLKENGDIWHGHDLETLPFVFIAARLKRGKVVYDSHELWQGYDWPGRGGRGNIIRRLLWRGWMWIEKVLAKRCHLVVAVNESCALEMTRLLGVQPLMLRNCVDPVVADCAAGGLRERLGLSCGEPLVVYAGQLQRGRGLENLLRAWAGLPGEWYLALIGRGVLEGELRNLALRAGLANIYFLPPVKAWELPGFICGASLGVALIEDTDLSKRCSLPNKLLEYIAAGVPVLASDLPEIRRLVAGYQTGVLVNPRDYGDIRNVLKELLSKGERLDRMRQNALKARESLTWEGEVSRLINGYSKIAGGL